MPNREIADKLASGEIPSIRVGGAAAGKEVALTEDLPLIDELTEHVTVESLSVTDLLRLLGFPDTREEAFLRLGVGGYVGMYHNHAIEEKWSDTDATDISIIASESAALLTATPAKTIPVGQGSFMYYAEIQNTTGADITTTWRLYVNSVLKDTRTFVVPASTTKTWCAGDIFVGAITSGHNVELTHEGSAVGCTIKGTTRTSTLKVYKAFEPSSGSNVLGKLDTNAGSYTLSTTPQPITNYTNENTVGLPVNKTTGLITCDKTGWYRVSFNMNGTLSASPTTDTVDIRVYDTVGAATIFSSSMDFTGSNTTGSRSASNLFYATAGADLRIEVSSTTTTANLTFPGGVTYDIVSANIE